MGYTATNDNTFREDSEYNKDELIKVSQINLHKSSPANLQHNKWMLESKG